MSLHLNGMFDVNTLPADCIADFEGGGSKDETVAFWLDNLGVTVNREWAQRELQGYGAWDDLDEADDDTLAGRILWLAASTFAEFLEFGETAGSDVFGDYGASPEDSP